MSLTSSPLPLFTPLSLPRLFYYIVHDIHGNDIISYNTRTCVYMEIMILLLIAPITRRAYRGFTDFKRKRIA